MSTLGVIITALLTGTFIHLFFNIKLSEGLLIGSVLSSILGLLSFPSKFINIIGISIGISIFMLVIARPLTTFLILTPFKYSKREKLFVSWVGLRGAASLVFTIYVITSKVPIKNDM